MTTSDNVPRWKRYLSPRFLVSKVREKGLVWGLQTGTRRLLRFLLSGITWVLACSLRPFLYPLGVRFPQLRSNMVGHLALEPDIYIKEGILGMRPKYFEIVLMPSPGPYRVANHHLLEYWRQHLRIVTSPLLCRLLAPLWRDRILSYDTLDYFHTDNKVAHYVTIQRKWNGRPPLLALTEADRERGWDCLQKLGVPEDAWFVCVHCRESGFAPSEYSDRYRNVDINNYLLAMKAIVERGGWCIRVGDPTMKPLPPMEHVIDYVHLSIRSDWMDVFLCAACKFLLGSNSGLYAVASIFGAPCAVANQTPLSVVLPYGPFDIGIPKLVWSVKEDRYLTFKEVLDSPIGHFPSMYFFTEAGVRMVENSPEDVRDLALEMLERTEGTLTYSAEDERLQERFKSLLRPEHYSYGASSRVGRDFLRKYAWLLPEAE